MTLAESSPQQTDVVTLAESSPQQTDVVTPAESSPQQTDVSQSVTPAESSPQETDIVTQAESSPQQTDVVTPAESSPQQTDEIVYASLSDDSEEIPYQALTRHAAVMDRESPEAQFPRVVGAKKRGSRRVWDKEMSCYFCKSLLKNKISEHLIRVHSSESEVARVLVHPARSAQRN